MSEKPTTIAELLEGVDKRRQPETVRSIAQRIRQFRERGEVSTSAEVIDLGDQWRAELIAFDLVPMDGDKPSSWGGYYGPLMVVKDEDGQWIESPSIRAITQDCISYWALRAKSVTHPVLRGRYADLVWNFSKIVSGESPPIDMARTVIDAAIGLMAERLSASDHEALIQIRRALSLALSIRDPERVRRLTEAIIAFEDQVAQDNSPRLCGFSFDLLINRKGVDLSISQEEKLVSDLESRLSRLSGVDTSLTLDPFSVEASTSRLALYYRRTERREDARRVLGLYADTYVLASERQSPLVAAGWLQDVFKTLVDYGLREKADEISHHIKRLSEMSRDEMGILSQEVKIDKEKIEILLQELLEGSIEKACARLAVYFLPDPTVAEEQVKELAREVPFYLMMPINIQDHDGRLVAQVGSVVDDLEGRVVLQMAQTMQYGAPFLRLAIDGLLAEYNPDNTAIVDFLLASPLFDASRRPLLERGVSAFLQRDKYATACILVPEIEAAIRRLIILSQGSIYRRGRSGSLLVSTLDQMLSDPAVRGVLGEPGVKYLRVLLTDQRAWNLRNVVCHGLLPARMFSVDVCNRLFHTLLYLAMFREKEGDEEVALETEE